MPRRKRKGGIKTKKAPPWQEPDEGFDMGDFLAMEVARTILELEEAGITLPEEVINPKKYFNSVIMFIAEMRRWSRIQLRNPKIMIPVIANKRPDPVLMAKKKKKDNRPKREWKIDSSRLGWKDRRNIRKELKLIDLQKVPVDKRGAMQGIIDAETEEEWDWYMRSMNGTQSRTPVIPAPSGISAMRSPVF